MQDIIIQVLSLLDMTVAPRDRGEKNSAKKKRTMHNNSVDYSWTMCAIKSVTCTIKPTELKLYTTIQYVYLKFLFR